MLACFMTITQASDRALSFGGGSYAGHGVNVTSGSARFVMRNFSVG